MITNYIKIAFRSIFKNKIHSGINIFGLGIGIACCTLILFFLKHELSFDKFHHKSQFIYRVLPDVLTIDVPSLSVPLLPELTKAYPEIEQAVRIYSDDGVVNVDGNSFETKLTYADPDFFKMFHFPLTKGNPNQVLTERFSVVLSKETANKYFGDEDPIGKTITLNHRTHAQSYIIRGITGLLQDNSSIQFSILLPFENLKHGQHAAAFNDWGKYFITGFIRLSENCRIDDLAQKLGPFFAKHMQIDLTAGYFDTPQKGLKFQPLSDYHLGDETGSSGLQPVNNRKYLYILTIIATLILLMACFNFITLTVGGSSGRFTEVGIRKVLGAQRSQLVKQFWFESALISGLAFIIGLLLTNLFLPTFNTFEKYSVHRSVKFSIFLTANSCCCSSSQIL